MKLYNIFVLFSCWSSTCNNQGEGLADFSRDSVTLMIMGCFLFTCVKRASSSTELTVDFDGVSGVENVNFYTFRELRLATDNFSQANKIGEGGYGPVHKGKLRDGTMAAIKVLSPESRQGLQEFLTELTVLADIVHDNLVEMLGCCIEGNNRILVSRYVENNSIEQTLLGPNQNKIDFTWVTRRKISIGIAEGLAFLHEGVQPHIIHRDIKASNILLDKDLTAKISDFGMAKLIPANMTHVSTKVAGTLGYLAPEYALRGQLTRKADVYSFGVLLLEIVCGRCNKNRRLPPGEQYLLQRAWRMLEKEPLVNLVDEAFRGEDLDVEEANRFLKIALICTQQMPNLRPSMSTVKKMLLGEVDVSQMQITQPGILSELTQVNSNDTPKELTDMKNSSPPIFSPESGSSSLPSGTDLSCPNMTFTSISARCD